MPFNASYILEDTAAHGAVLGFPGVSTCVAVVARKANELVGWHVTTDTLNGFGTRGTATLGALKFIEFLQAGSPVEAIYIVGPIEGNHDPVRIRDWIRGQLANPVLRTLSFELRQEPKARTANTFHIFFTHTGATPLVQFKRSSKTHEGGVAGGERVAAALVPAAFTHHNAGMLIHNRTATFSAEHLHSLRQNFVEV